MKLNHAINIKFPLQYGIFKNLNLTMIILLENLIGMKLMIKWFFHFRFSYISQESQKLNYLYIEDI